MRRGLQVANCGSRCRTHRHSSARLEKAKTLEAFLKPFAHESILYDPTGAFARARKLQHFAEELRASLGKKISELLWHSRSATVYIVLDEKRCLQPDGMPRPGLDTLKKDVSRTFLSVCGPNASEPVRAVRLAFARPPVPLTPIDNASIRQNAPIWQAVKNNAAASAIAAILGIGSAGLAYADDAMQHKAVSRTNGELAILGGVRDGEGAALFEGALVAPLGQRFGARVDGTIGSSNSDVIGGAGLHLFWRDPTRALFGVAGGYAAVDPDGPRDDLESFWRFGAEAELYFDRLTLSGFAGGQFDDDGVEDGFIGRLDIEWYPTDNLMLSAGGEWNPEREGLGRVSAEYLPGFAALPGMTVFAEGAIGDEDYHRVFGGLRFYFGPSRTLKEKHRYDTFRTNIMSTRMTDTPVENERVATTAAYGG